MKISILFFIISAVIGGCGGTQNADTLLKPGALAPEFSVMDNTGEMRSLSSLIENGPVVLTFLRSFY